MRTGDLLGSGTISGVGATEKGAFVEATEGGKFPVKLEGGDERTYLEDGDEIVTRGISGKESSYVGFGDFAGKIVG